MGNSRLNNESLNRLFLKYVIPAVIAMVISGMQSMIDGLFLGRYAGTDSMASVNIAIPYMQLVMGCTMVVCIGTVSYLARTLGMQNESSDRKGADIFRSSFVTLGAVSVIIMLAGILADRQIAAFLGANDVLMDETASYIHTLAFFVPAVCMMVLFGFTARVLGNPNLYLAATVACLVINVTADYVAIKVLDLGAAGAAAATGLAYLAGFLVTCRPLLDRKSTVNIFKGHFRKKLILHTVFNGSSEGVMSASTAVTIWFFNAALMNYAGEDGVAAFTVINYISNFVILVMFGVSDGIGTLVSYNYGSGKMARVRGILKRALIANFVTGAVIFAVFNIFTGQLIGIFIEEQPYILEMAVHGAHIYSFAFLMNGFNIVQSGYQTAIGNSAESALIAGCRGLIFITAGMMTLPRFMGINGVWVTVPAAELCTVAVCCIIYRRKNRNMG